MTLVVQNHRRPIWGLLNPQPWRDTSTLFHVLHNSLLFALGFKGRGYHEVERPNACIALSHAEIAAIWHQTEWSWIRLNPSYRVIWLTKAQAFDTSNDSSADVHTGWWVSGHFSWRVNHHWKANVCITGFAIACFPNAQWWVVTEHKRFKMCFLQKAMESWLSVSPWKQASAPQHGATHTLSWLIGRPWPEASSASPHSGSLWLKARPCSLP